MSTHVLHTWNVHRVSKNALRGPTHNLFATTTKFKPVAGHCTNSRWNLLTSAESASQQNVPVSSCYAHSSDLRNLRIAQGLACAILGSMRNNLEIVAQCMDHKTAEECAQ